MGAGFGSKHLPGEPGLSHPTGKRASLFSRVLPFLLSLFVFFIIIFLVSVKTQEGAMDCRGAGVQQAAWPG